MLSKEKDNFLIVFSDNAAYSFDLTRRFFELRNEYNLTLFGLPDWSSMEGLEAEYLVALKTHLVSASFIDYENLQVKHFVGGYHAAYHTDPDLLAFQGYDVAFYFLSALSAYGTNFQRCMADLRVKSLQSGFDFRQAKGQGFENQQWMIYRYDNFRLVKAN